MHDEGFVARGGCWVRTYVRGLGHTKKTCGEGETYARNKCFSKCKDGFVGIDGICYQNCNAGTSTSGGIAAMASNTTSPFCHRP